MNDSNALFDAQNHYMVSYELLSLLQWMVEHDGATLKKMVGRAFKAGLQQELQYAQTLTESERADNAHYSVMEFFGLLEVLMHETMHEQTEQRALQKNLMPAIDQIDGTACDDNTIRLSVEKAAARLSANPKANPQAVLFKELLKQWKPSKKGVVN
jgi:hypothetical protein